MKIIEMTGISGVGKSYILNILTQKYNVISDKEIIKQSKLHDLKLLYLFFHHSKSLKILFILIKIMSLYRVPLFDKVNFLRNSIKKIGKNYYFTHLFESKNFQIILVDEGVSHLFQNIITIDNPSNYSLLLRLIEEVIETVGEKHHVLFVDAKNETIAQRLKNRGHRLIKNENEIDTFIKISRMSVVGLKKNYNRLICKVENEKDFLNSEEYERCINV